MNTDKINETLAILETNLRNIKSAREQVEIVTDSSDNLVNSVNNLLTETKQLSNHFKEREENSLKELKQFKSLTEELNTSQKIFIKDIINTHKSHLMDFENSIKKLKSDTENEILKIKELSVNTIKQQTLEISNCLEEFKILSNDNNKKIENINKKQLTYSVFIIMVIISGFFYISMYK